MVAFSMNSGTPFSVPPKSDEHSGVLDHGESPHASRSVTEILETDLQGLGLRVDLGAGWLGRTWWVCAVAEDRAGQ